MSSANKAIQFAVASATGPAFSGSMSIGTWYALSGSAPDLGLSATNVSSDVDPDPGRSQAYSGQSGFGAIFTAWGSGCIASSLGSDGSFLFYGGGHRDYYGNGIVRFDITTRTWSMLTQPSTAGPFTAGASLTNGAYTDGTPSPPHPYNFEHFDTLSNSLVCLKSITNINAPDSGSSSVARPWMYSLTTSSWRRGPNNASILCPTNGCGCYDTTRNAFWTLDHSGGDFGKFDPAGDNGDGTFGTWTTSLQSASFGSGSQIAHDPVNDKLIVFNFSTGNLWLKDPNNIAAARVAVTQSGAPSMVALSGCDYSAQLGGFVVQMVGTGNAYLVKTTNNWANCTWTLLTASANGKNFSNTQANGNSVNGINGRSRIVEYGSVVLLLFARTAADPVLAMRLQ